MIQARFGSDSDLGTKERRAKFGHEFFHRIGVVAEALAKLPITALFVRSPMRQFVKERRVVCLGGGAGGGADE